jgi:hypothetical protein
VKYTELSPNERAGEIGQINGRWGQLYGLEKEAAEQGIKFLFLTNAGGAVAVLSFIGTSDVVRLLIAPKIALGLFALGVVLNGVLLALRLHQFERLFKQWREDVDTYFKGDLDRDELYKRDNQRANTKMYVANYIVAHSSFICFIAGGVIGFCSLIAA